jgi:hypothetical protein
VSLYWRPILLKPEKKSFFHNFLNPQPIFDVLKPNLLLETLQGQLLGILANFKKIGKPSKEFHGIWPKDI